MIVLRRPAFVVAFFFADPDALRGRGDALRVDLGLMAGNPNPVAKTH